MNALQVKEFHLLLPLALEIIKIECQNYLPVSSLGSKKIKIQKQIVLFGKTIFKKCFL